MQGEILHKHYVLTETSDFQSIVKALDEFGMGVVAITDGEGVLKGIVADGDVRRALLNRNYDIKDLINTNPEVMNYGVSQREIVARLKDIKRRNIPLVDECGRLKNVFCLEDVEFVSKDNVVVIMAGGLGTRLGELTKMKPKPMLHLAEKPMLQHLIEMFNDHGYNKFVISVNYKKEIIMDYFGTGERLGVHIQYIEENKRLGTAGSLSLLDPVPSAPFFVINGDVLTALNLDELLRFHEGRSSIATMCVRQYSHKVPFGVVKINDENIISHIEEKPVSMYSINAGIYILNPDVVSFVPKDEYLDMPSLFETVMAAGHTASVYHVTDYWMDIGRPNDFEEASRVLSYRNQM